MSKVPLQPENFLYLRFLLYLINGPGNYFFNFLNKIDHGRLTI